MHCILQWIVEYILFSYKQPRGKEAFFFSFFSPTISALHRCVFLLLYVVSYGCSLLGFYFLFLQLHRCSTSLPSCLLLFSPFSVFQRAIQYIQNVLPAMQDVVRAHRVALGCLCVRFSEDHKT